MTQWWHQHVAWFSERYLGQAGLCFPALPASGGLVTGTARQGLEKSSLQGSCHSVFYVVCKPLVFLAFLGITGTGCQSFPHKLCCLNFSSPQLQPPCLWRHRDSHNNSSSSAGGVKHHLEWHSLSGHKSPGTCTATPVPITKKINYHESTSLH